MVKSAVAVPSLTTLMSCRRVILLLLLLQFLFLIISNHNVRNPSLVQCYVTKRSHLSPSTVVNKSQLSKQPYSYQFHSSSFISSIQRRHSIRIIQLYEKKSDSKQEQEQQQQQQVVRLDMTLTDDRIRKLYAWICQAFYGNDDRYNNLMYAMVAVFGNLPLDSPILILLDRAIQKFDKSIQTNALMGDHLSQYDRERASLGAMGAAQWMGQWKTRPHALLDISNYTCIQDWEKTLPRGCKRTVQRAVQAEQSNFTVVSKPIRHNHPAPHSTYEHFKCVVQHEVRLLSNMYYINSDETYNNNDSDNDTEEYDKVSVLLNALSEAISRYMGTTQMTGLIREYRNHNTNNNNNEVIAFAHEIRKGQTIRGQWFYATDTAAKQYVWFHSVRSLIERAIQENNHWNTSQVKDINNNITTTTTTSTTTTTTTAVTSLFPFLINPRTDSYSNNKNDNGHIPITIVDLGPSGSDDFSELKSKYGFISVEDWPSIANYHGPFWDYTTNAPAQNGVKY